MLSTKIFIYALFLKSLLFLRTRFSLFCPLGFQNAPFFVSNGHFQHKKIRFFDARVIYFSKYKMRHAAMLVSLACVEQGDFH